MLPLVAKFTIRNNQMPLAVYREVAAHLRQIPGVSVTFLTPIDREFSYTESQVGGLEVTLADQCMAQDRVWIDRLLAYYADRYGLLEISN